MASHLPPPPPPPPGHESAPPPPPPAPSGPSPYTTWTLPPSPPGDRRVGGWLGFLAGLAVTIALVAALVVAWPDDEAVEPVSTDAPSTTLMTKEAAAAVPQVPGAPDRPDVSTTTTIAVDLFAEGPAAAVAALRATAGSPDRLLQITVYDTYLFVEYVEPTDPERIVRRIWRSGNVGDVEANPIDDAVDATTRPKLFGDGEIDLAKLPQIVADAPSHYAEPVQVTHVIIDRFLPFDQRVLVRVYASPPGNPTGGGYVSYTTSGTLVKVCC